MPATKNNPREDTSDREIVISRVFDAPRELVWQAMTDPQHVVRWWGPNGFTTTIEKMDLRPGGVWKHVMHGPDGTDYPNNSVFQEIVQSERIVYSHSGGRKSGPGAIFKATWAFETEDDKTKVTIRMVFPSAAARDQVVKEYGAIEGGQQTLARLAGHLAKTPVIMERTFNALVATVWKAITDKDQMKQWYFENLDSFKPEVGFQTQFNVRHGGNDYLHIWKVTEVVPEKKIAYSWKFGRYPGDSLVTFELFSEGDKTRLKMTHQGLETFLPENNPALARGNFVKGWAHFIGSSLKEFVEKAVSSTDRPFVITRLFDAPCALVFKAWTEPPHLAQWWGPKNFTNPVCQVNLQPGGTYRIVMRSPDGVEYPLQSVYLEIVENERLVMTIDTEGHPAEWHDLFNEYRGRKRDAPAMKAIMTVAFEEHGGKTKLTVMQHFESTADHEANLKMGAVEGWAQSLERLEEHLAKA